MANTTIASNSTGRDGIWKPYYHKPYNLGALDTAADDGVTYITQTVGSSGEAMEAICTDEFNCGYYYDVVIKKGSGTLALFYVKKYDLEDKLVDTIYASGTSGNPRYTVLTDNEKWIIDIGVMIKVGDVSEYDNTDEYRIKMPTAEFMRNRRIYHGGYTTYVRTPEDEGVAYRSKILPTSLLYKNIKCITGFPDPFGDGDDYVLQPSYESTLGNLAITVSLEWNINPSGVESGTASSTDWTDDNQIVAAETWHMGTIFASDIDPGSTANMPIVTQAPAEDVQTSYTGNRGSAEQSGRGGHVRLKCEFMTGPGSTIKIPSHSQWLPTTLILG